MRRTISGRRTPVDRRTSMALIAGVLAACAFAGSASAQIQAGDILVADFSAGGGALGRLFRVLPENGVRTVVTEFSAFPSTGADDPRWIAIERDGRILIVDQDAGTNLLGALIRIDPGTGIPEVLSDFGDSGQGLVGGWPPQGVAVEADGRILVMVAGAGGTPQTPARLFRIDPDDGTRTVLSDFSLGDNTGSGSAIAVEADGQILVLDPSGDPKIYRVDPDDGTRTVVSVLRLGATPVTRPRGIAVEANGQILVVDVGAGTNAWGLLVRVDPVTGAQDPDFKSDFGDSGQGPLGQPQAVAIEADGSILVTDPHAGTSVRGALFRVDPGSGARVLLSDFGVSGQGELGLDPFGVAVVPSLPGTLIVIKTVVNNNGGSSVPSDWTITVTGTKPSPATFAGAPAPGTAVTLDPGTYSVTATGPAGYSSTPSVDCAGTIAAGGTKTCTITSDDEPPAALPDLVVSTLQAPGSVLRGRVLTIQEATANTATVGAAGASITAFYLSIDLIVDPTDIPLGSRAVANLGPGASASGATSVTVPVSVTPGTYFIIAVADVNGVVAESSESNNTLSRRIKVR